MYQRVAHGNINIKKDIHHTPLSRTLRSGDQDIFNITFNLQPACNNLFPIVN